MARGDVIKRLIQGMCKDLARAEFIHQMGQAWRGGKLDVNYISGRIPFLNLPLLSGTVLVSIPAWDDTSTLGLLSKGDYGTQHITFPTAYPATTLNSAGAGGTTSFTLTSVAGLFVGQRLRFTQISGGMHSNYVVLTSVNLTSKTIVVSPVTDSYNVGDTVQVAPDIALGSGDIGWIPSYGNVTNTGFDLTLARRVSLTNSEGGLIPSSSVLMPAGAFAIDVGPISFPTAYQAVPIVIPQTNDPAFTAVATSITTSDFHILVTHTPIGSSGTIDYATTGLSVDSNTTGLTVDDYHGDTGTTDANHHHNVPVHDYTASAGPTDGQSNEHGHHNDHGHPPTDPGHDHTLTEPLSGGNTGHHHVFNGTSTAVVADTHIPLQWQAWGTRTSPAVTKEASWIARGQ